MARLGMSMASVLGIGVWLGVEIPLFGVLGPLGRVVKTLTGP